MTDNIKSLVERLRSGNSYCDAYIYEAADLIEQQAARITELEARLGARAGEPYAYELHLPNDEYSLVYAAYLAKYATEEERACDRLELYAAPVADSAMAKDAERYRWLRSQVLPFKAYASGNPNWTFPGHGPRGESFDEAIDAAIAASAQKGAKA